MKKFHYLWLSVLCLMGCSTSNSTQDTDSTLQGQEETMAEIKEIENANPDSIRQDSIENEKALQLKNEADQTKIEAFLRDYYDHYLLGTKDPEMLKKHFSTSVLKRLAKLYNDEWGDSGAATGYAFYAMRGDSEDPSGKMTGFTPLGDDWYQINFREDGNTFTVKIQAKVENGNVMVTDFKSPTSR